MAAIAPVTRLSSRVVRILGCNPSPMTLQGTNTYLIGTGKKRILLDTGDKDVPDYVAFLNNVVKQENVDISHVIITHWHHDHIGGIHNIYKNLNSDCKIWKYEYSLDEEFPPSVKFNWLEDGQEVKVEGATVKIHHTPGHTEDHIVLSLLEDGVLFSGDCILGEGTAVFEDLYNYMKSLNKILEIKPSVIYPGHGNVVEDPISKIQFYINHRNQRESQILNVLKEKQVPMTINQLVEIVYNDTPKELWPAASMNLIHHLTKLLKEKKVVRVEQNDEDMWQYKNMSPL